MTSPLIKPTIGRVVWFYPAGHSREAQALPALIAYVHSDTLINVGGFDRNGELVSDTFVTLVPAGEPLPAIGACATWMPYQAAQAAKAETPQPDPAK